MIGLLKKYPLVIIGSVLEKDNPRDIDMLCVIPNSDFEKIFGLSAKQWREEGKTGKWSNERYLWAEETVKVGNVLIHRFGNINIDFKFIPQSFYEETKVFKK